MLLHAMVSSKDDLFIGCKQIFKEQIIENLCLFLSSILSLTETLILPTADDLIEIEKRINFVYIEHFPCLRLS